MKQRITRQPTQLLAIIVVGGTSVFFAGNALAGSGCLYSQQGELAKLDGPTAPIAEHSVVDPTLLALLKKQEAQRQASNVELLPVIHN